MKRILFISVLASCFISTILFAYNVTITSNIPGVTIYEDSLAVGVAPQTFPGLTGFHIWGVMDISTQVKPADMAINESGTYAFDYSNPLNIVGGASQGSYA